MVKTTPTSKISTPAQSQNRSNKQVAFGRLITEKLQIQAAGETLRGIIMVARMGWLLQELWRRCSTSIMIPS